MSDESKHNVDELLSGYVDGELSKRKYTELKRLMEHDPQLVEKYDVLKKQKHLLNFMPVESAPEGLLDAVIASEERKIILDEYSEATGQDEGLKHLMFRRALTAAVIFVLFGGLIGLIAHIISPPEVTNNKVASYSGQPEADLLPVGMPAAESKNTAADTPIFRASLELETEQAIAMNSYIMKAVFTHDLNSFVNPPENNGNSSTIRITCGIERIVKLLDEIRSEWDKCSKVALSVYDHALDKELVIENISSNQLMRVFNEDKFYSRMQLARDYADFNKLNTFGNNRFANRENIESVKPELTSPSKTERKDRLEGGEKISLVITVTGL